MATIQLLSAFGITVMSFLLYGVVHGDRIEPREKPNCPGYPRASIMVRTARLGGIVSRLSPADADPDVARLLVYSKIVESFNHERAIIPMRYGSRFKAIDDIAAFLTHERETFGALLDDLDGRVEMSARVPLDELRDDRANPDLQLLSPGLPSGMRYLASRQRHYSFIDQSDARREEARKSLYAMAAGISSGPSLQRLSYGPKSMLTVHFLVPREGVERFTRALRPNRDQSIEVSGPWPPYNFISSKYRSFTI